MNVRPAVPAIDAHHHLWDLNAVSYPWLMATGQRRFFGDPAPIQRDYLVEEFRSDAEAAGCKASVHIQVGAEDPLAEARWVQTVAESNPGWPAAQVAFCDLTHPDAEANLEKLARLSSVRGIRQIVGRSPEEDLRDGANSLLSDPAFRDGLRKAASMGLSFDLQLIPELMQETAELLADIPSLPVALCHAGSPRDLSEDCFAEWQSGICRLADLPNVVCKISGLGMFHSDWNPAEIQPVIDHCLSVFGPGRCMFGSNFPVDMLSAPYSNVITAYAEAVPESSHSDVFSRTASRFYDI